MFDFLAFTQTVIANVVGYYICKKYIDSLL